MDEVEKKNSLQSAAKSFDEIKANLTMSSIDPRGSHSTAQVESDLNEFRKSEDPTQKQRDNLLESLAGHSVEMAIWNRMRAEATKRIEENISSMKDSMLSGLSEIKTKVDSTNSRIDTLDEWRKTKDKLDAEQSKMIEDNAKLHQSVVDILEEVKGRLNSLEKTDSQLAEEVHEKITELKETDDKYGAILNKLKEWKIRIMGGALVLFLLFKYDFIQIPDKYINTTHREDPIVKPIDKKRNKDKPK